jgi:hypothetical protein
MVRKTGTHSSRMTSSGTIRVCTVREAFSKGCSARILYGHLHPWLSSQQSHLCRSSSQNTHRNGSGFTDGLASSILTLSTCAVVTFCASRMSARPRLLYYTTKGYFVNYIIKSLSRLTPITLGRSIGWFRA